MFFYSFLGEGFFTKIDYGKKGTLILTSLLEDLEADFSTLGSTWIHSSPVGLRARSAAVRKSHEMKYPMGAVSDTTQCRSTFNGAMISLGEYCIPAENPRNLQFGVGGSCISANQHEWNRGSSAN